MKERSRVWASPIFHCPAQAKAIIPPCPDEGKKKENSRKKGKKKKGNTTTEEEENRALICSLLLQGEGKGEKERN